MKGTSSDAQATTKRAAKPSLAAKKTQGEEVALGQEVVDRLKSWCYV